MGRHPTQETHSVPGVGGIRRQLDEFGPGPGADTMDG
jgi:hypothetical protein